MNPPWKQHPDIPWGSIGWRMGPGEDYWSAWVSWYKSLSLIDRSNYQQQWPESGRWIGFYEFIQDGTPPPWAKEFREKLSQPQALPDEAEVEINDYFRIVWLIRNHFKRDNHPENVHSSEARRRKDEDGNVEFHFDSTGQVWRLGFLAKGGLRLSRAKPAA